MGILANLSFAISSNRSAWLRVFNTYSYSNFQLFELCNTVADWWSAIIHLDEEGAKWSAAVCCFPVLEETFERDIFWWTVSASADGASDPNRVSPAGLDLEKSDEFAPSLTRSVAQMGQGPRKLWNCTFSMGNSWCRSVTLFYGRLVQLVLRECNLVKRSSKVASSPERVGKNSGNRHKCSLRPHYVELVVKMYEKWKKRKSHLKTLVWPGIKTGLL